MKFKTPEELVDFFNNLDFEKSNIVFKNDKNKCQCHTKKTPFKVNESDVKINILPASDVIIESFSDDPSFKLEISESGDNLFFVKNYEAVADVCGTGQITLNDRISYMNMCEMDNKATVHLTVIIEGKKFTNIPFTLVKTDKEPYLQINKDQLL